MSLTIEQLIDRVLLLESQIQLLLSFKLKVKRVYGYKLFEKYFIPHVRTSLLRQYYIHTGNYDFKPKYSDIIKEISSMWSDISHDEKLHWTHS